MRKLLPIATIPIVIIMAYSLPDWLVWLGGGLGVGWWVCRYAWWASWEARRAEIRRTGR